MYNYYRWFPKGKVVFLAPTRPLVQQQAEACRVTMGIPRAHMCELTGSSRKDDDGSRAGAWAAHRVIFATPQTFANDLARNVCPAASLVALVLDEAHRATGNYAYAVAARHLELAGVRCRILALSATPGTTSDGVQEVLRTLRIGAVEFRSEEDEDVAPYTHRRIVDVRAVPASACMAEAQALYVSGYRPLVTELLAMRVLQAGGGPDDFGLLTNTFAFIRARQALSSSAELQGALGSRVGRAHQLLTQCNMLARGLHLLYTDGIRPALDYLLASKEAFDKLNSRPLNEALRLMQTVAAGGEALSPKLQELNKVLREHFRAASAGAAAAGEAAAASTRAIVFTSGRESVRHVMEELASLRSAGVKASEFIGQGDSTARGAGRERKRGQTQAEQSAILASFRRGDINVIVATCIGEEGLDVPQVDLVVFLDAVGIIRLVQRMGRTGRAREGRVVVLAAEGKEINTWNQKNAECVLRTRARLQLRGSLTQAHVRDHAGPSGWATASSPPPRTLSCAPRARACCRTATRRRWSCATSCPSPRRRLRPRRRRGSAPRRPPSPRRRAAAARARRSRGRASICRTTPMRRRRRRSLPPSAPRRSRRLTRACWSGAATREAARTRTTCPSATARTGCRRHLTVTRCTRTAMAACWLLRHRLRLRCRPRIRCLWALRTACWCLHLRWRAASRTWRRRARRARCWPPALRCCRSAQAASSTSSRRMRCLRPRRLPRTPRWCWPTRRRPRRMPPAPLTRTSST